jgi:3-isopropylmalate/(R)-2-methylmalate dehydratase large subunit
MNMIEKILARRSGKREVTPGEVVVADVATIIFHDLSSYLTDKVLRDEVKSDKVLDPDRICVSFDHFFSPATEEGARILQADREFVRRLGIKNFFDSGTGNCHHVPIERGLIRPGTVVVGSDSHTPVHGALGTFATGIGNNSIAAMAMPIGKAWFRVPPTVEIRLEGALPPGVTCRDVCQFLVMQFGEEGMNYKAVQYTGSLIDRLEVGDRILFPLMCIDMGTKAGFIDPDEKTLAFIRERTDQEFEVFHNDPGVTFESSHEFDVSKLEPLIACPPSVGNGKRVSEVVGVPITHAEIGATPGGRIEDFRMAAQMLKGRHIHPNVRFQAVPLTRKVFKQALEEGIIEILHDAGANLFPAGSGSNQATNMGAMVKGQTMIGTLPRNFPGRHGSKDAQVYLASTYTTVASAIKGEITDPREFL